MDRDPPGPRPPEEASQQSMPTLSSWMLVQAGVPERKGTLSEHWVASPSTSQHRIAPYRSLETRDHPKHVPLSLAASATGCVGCPLRCRARSEPPADPCTVGLCPNCSSRCRLGLEPRLPLPSLQRAGGQPLAPGLPASLPGRPGAAACSAFLFGVGARQQAQAGASSLALGEPRVPSTVRAQPPTPRTAEGAWLGRAGCHPCRRLGAEHPSILALGSSSLQVCRFGDTTWGKAKGPRAVLVQCERREPPCRLTHRSLGCARELAGSGEGCASRSSQLCWKPFPGTLGASVQQHWSGAQP